MLPQALRYLPCHAILLPPLIRCHFSRCHGRYAAADAIDAAFFFDRH